MYAVSYSSSGSQWNSCGADDAGSGVMAKSIVPSRSCDWALAIRLSDSSSRTAGTLLRNAITAGGSTVSISQGVIAALTRSAVRPRSAAISPCACSS